jgi:hypothetical protein
MLIYWKVGMGYIQLYMRYQSRTNSDALLAESHASNSRSVPVWAGSSVGAFVLLLMVNTSVCL